MTHFPFASEESSEPVPEFNEPSSTSVRILSDRFYIPQLDRYRRIWTYLPVGYEHTGNRFPVLYMHDGQNLFEEATSFNGEWQIDETLDRMTASGYPGIMVVGIDNGQDLRMTEYNPWDHPEFGKGEGKAYVQFIVETLKPFIDRNYRTRPDAEHTGIMGSSMGGLISFYAIMTYPDIFGKAGIFSPSFWMSEEVFALQAIPRSYMKIYMNLGSEEAPKMRQPFEQMREILARSGWNENQLTTQIVENGNHGESFWAHEFQKAYTWLYG